MKSIKSTLSFAAVAAVAVAAATLSASAFAGDYSDNNPGQLLPPTQSTLTREQVRAEYLQAVKDGSIVRISEAGAPPMATQAPASQVTRAQVHAEAVTAAHKPASMVNPG